MGALLIELIHILVFFAFLILILWLFAPHAGRVLKKERRLSLFVFCLCIGVLLLVYELRIFCPGYYLICEVGENVRIWPPVWASSDGCQMCVDRQTLNIGVLTWRANQIRGALELLAAGLGILGGFLGLLFERRWRTNT